MLLLLIMLGCCLPSFLQVEMLDVEDTPMMLGAGGGLMPGGSKMASKRFWRVSKQIPPTPDTAAASMIYVTPRVGFPWARQDLRPEHEYQ